MPNKKNGVYKGKPRRDLRGFCSEEDLISEIGVPGMSASSIPEENLNFLLDIFPNVDQEIIQAVLLEFNGSLNESIEKLSEISEEQSKQTMDGKANDLAIIACSLLADESQPLQVASLEITSDGAEGLARDQSDAALPNPNLQNQQNLNRTMRDSSLSEESSSNSAKHLNPSMLIKNGMVKSASTSVNDNILWLEKLARVEVNNCKSHNIYGDENDKVFKPKPDFLNSSACSNNFTEEPGESKSRKELVNDLSWFPNKAKATSSSSSEALILNTGVKMNAVNSERSIPFENNHNREINNSITEIKMENNLDKKVYTTKLRSLSEVNGRSDVTVASNTTQSDNLLNSWSNDLSDWDKFYSGIESDGFNIYCDNIRLADVGGSGNNSTFAAPSVAENSTRLHSSSAYLENETSGGQLRMNKTQRKKDSKQKKKAGKAAACIDISCMFKNSKVMPNSRGPVNSTGPASSAFATPFSPSAQNIFVPSGAVNSTGFFSSSLPAPFSLSAQSSDSSYFTASREDYVNDKKETSSKVKLSPGALEFIQRPLATHQATSLVHGKTTQIAAPSKTQKPHLPEAMPARKKNSGNAKKGKHQTLNGDPGFLPYGDQNNFLQHSDRSSQSEVTRQDFAVDSQRNIDPMDPLGWSDIFSESKSSLLDPKPQRPRKARKSSGGNLIPQPAQEPTFSPWHTGSERHQNASRSSPLKKQHQELPGDRFSTSFGTTDASTSYPVHTKSENGMLYGISSTQTSNTSIARRLPPSLTSPAESKATMTSAVNSFTENASMSSSLAAPKKMLSEPDVRTQRLGVAPTQSQLLHNRLQFRGVKTPVGVIRRYTLEKHPVVIILRGLPGSGKSYLAKQLIAESQRMGVQGDILSTDDFFTAGGQYCYNKNDLPEAHDWNKKRTLQCVKEGRSPVIIDNTNTTMWELLPYAVLALEHGYDIQMFEPDTPWRMKVMELARKNVHGVQKENIKRMKDRWENFTLEDVLKQASNSVATRQKVHAVPNNTPVVTTTLTGQQPQAGEKHMAQPEKTSVAEVNHQKSSSSTRDPSLQGSGLSDPFVDQANSRKMKKKLDLIKSPSKSPKHEITQDFLNQSIKKAMVNLCRTSPTKTEDQPSDNNLAGLPGILSSDKLSDCESLVRERQLSDEGCNSDSETPTLDTDIHFFGNTSTGQTNMPQMVQKEAVSASPDFPGEMSQNEAVVLNRSLSTSGSFCTVPSSSDMSSYHTGDGDEDSVQFSADIFSDDDSGDTVPAEPDDNGDTVPMEPDGSRDIVPMATNGSRDRVPLESDDSVVTVPFESDVQMLPEEKHNDDLSAAVVEAEEMPVRFENMSLDTDKASLAGLMQLGSDKCSGYSDSCSLEISSSVQPAKIQPIDHSGDVGGLLAESSPKELEAVAGESVNNVTVPSGEKTVPSGENIVPSGENIVPSGEKTVPSGENIVPSRENIVPSGENIVPSGENTVPSGKNIDRKKTCPNSPKQKLGNADCLPGAVNSSSLVDYSDSDGDDDGGQGCPDGNSSGQECPDGNGSGLKCPDVDVCTEISKMSLDDLAAGHVHECCSQAQNGSDTIGDSNWGQIEDSGCVKTKQGTGSGVDLAQITVSPDRSVDNRDICKDGSSGDREISVVELDSEIKINSGRLILNGEKIVNSSVGDWEVSLDELVQHRDKLVNSLMQEREISLLEEIPQYRETIVNGPIQNTEICLNDSVQEAEIRLDQDREGALDGSDQNRDSSVHGSSPDREPSVDRSTQGSEDSTHSGREQSPMIDSSTAAGDLEVRKKKRRIRRGRNPGPFIEESLKVKSKTQNWSSFVKQASEFSSNSLGESIVLDAESHSVDTWSAATQTDPYDFSIVYKLNSPAFNSLQPVDWTLRGVSVISSSSQADIHKKLQAAADESCAVPFRKTGLSADQSTCTDETLEKEEADLETLKSCFPEYSRKQLEATMAICQNDLEWVTSHLLDSPALYDMEDEEEDGSGGGIVKSEADPAKSRSSASVKSLADMCTVLVKKTNKVDPDDLEMQLIQVGEGRLQKIEMFKRYRCHSSNHDGCGGKEYWPNDLFLDEISPRTKSNFKKRKSLEHKHSIPIKTSILDHELLAQNSNSLISDTEKPSSALQDQKGQEPLQYSEFGSKDASSRLSGNAASEEVNEPAHQSAITQNQPVLPLEFVRHLERLYGPMALSLDDCGLVLDDSTARRIYNCLKLQGTKNVCKGSQGDQLTKNASKGSHTDQLKNDEALARALQAEENARTSFSSSSLIPDRQGTVPGWSTENPSWMTQPQRGDLAGTGVSSITISEGNDNFRPNSVADTLRHLRGSQWVRVQPHKFQHRRPGSMKSVWTGSRRRGHVDSLISIMQEEKDREEQQREQMRIIESNGDMEALATRIKRIELSHLFPSMAPDVLEDIFRSNGYSKEETIRTLYQSYNIPPVPMSQDKEEILSQLRKGHERFENAEDMYEEDTPSEDSESSYEGYRDEATFFRQLANDCQQQALRYQSNGMQGAALFYRQRAKKYKEDEKVANSRAANVLFDKGSDRLQLENTLDLHFYRLDEAINAVNVAIELKEEEYRKRPDKKNSYLDIVTGWGRNSKNGKAKLKPAIIHHLYAKSFQYEEKSPGMLRVYLSKKF